MISLISLGIKASYKMHVVIFISRVHQLTSLIAYPLENKSTQDHILSNVQISGDLPIKRAIWIAMIRLMLFHIVLIRSDEHLKMESRKQLHILPLGHFGNWNVGNCL